VQVLEHIYSNVVVLEPTERLTVETEIDLKDAVRRQLDAGRRHLVLDLKRVPYVDSCGLGTMVQAYVSAHRAGGSVKLRNVTPRVHHLLAITRLSTVFEFYQPGVRAVGA
jgi:stage II sporulation protein AA (anti-sigma F factor antagonist)